MDQETTTPVATTEETSIQTEETAPVAAPLPKEYHLVIPTSDNKTVRASYDTLNDVYKAILNNNLTEGSYFIFKGKIII
jgi:hypothetical protein